MIDKAPAPKTATLTQAPLAPAPSATLTQPPAAPPAKLLLVPKKVEPAVGPAPPQGQVKEPQVEVRRLSLNMGLAIKEPPNLDAKASARKLLQFV